MLAVTDAHGDRQRWCAKRTSDDSEPGGGQIDEIHLDAWRGRDRARTATTPTAPRPGGDVRLNDRQLAKRV
jgi:hypothetical protein